MNKKIVISIISLTLLAFAAGIGTYAVFSDTVESSGNSFKAGYVRIGLDSEGAFVTNTTPMKIGESYSKDVTVYNKDEEQSTLMSDYTVTADEETGSDRDLYNSLYLVITKNILPEGEGQASVQEMYKGYVHDLKNHYVGSFTNIADSDNLHFVISLPTLEDESVTDIDLPSERKDNILQGKTASIKFTFNAKQQ